MSRAYAIQGDNVSFDTIWVDINLGNENAPSGPGTYELDGDPSNCSFCVFAQQNCQGQQCQKLFFGTEGFVEVETLSELSPQFFVRLYDIVLEELEVTTPTSFALTVGGDDWCIDELQLGGTYQ